MYSFARELLAILTRRVIGGAAGVTRRALAARGRVKWPRTGPPGESGTGDHPSPGYGWPQPWDPGEVPEENEGEQDVVPIGGLFMFDVSEMSGLDVLAE